MIVKFTKCPHGNWSAHHAYVDEKGQVVPEDEPCPGGWASIGDQQRRTPHEMAVLLHDWESLDADEGWELGVADGVTFANNPDGKDGLILLVPSRPHFADRRSYRLVPVETTS